MRPNKVTQGVHGDPYSYIYIYISRVAGCTVLKMWGQSHIFDPRRPLVWTWHLMVYSTSQFQFRPCDHPPLPPHHGVMANPPPPPCENNALVRTTGRVVSATLELLDVGDSMFWWCVRVLSQWRGNPAWSLYASPPPPPHPHPSPPGFEGDELTHTAQETFGRHLVW